MSDPTLTIRFDDEGAPLHDADLDAFEQRVRVRLPAEYRTFLKKHNGGRVEPYTIASRDATCPTAHIQYFLSIGPPTNVEAKWEMYKDHEQPRMPPEHIPIAKCEGGDYLTMVIDGPKRGQVYYWDHEAEGDETYTYDNLYFVARSLDELLASLHE